MNDVDVIVIGAGIAGASIAYFLSAQARVAVLERESQPGQHSTGRSAAMFDEGYGSPQVRALTRASRAFLVAPPPGFAEHPLLAPRGVLMIGGDGDEAAVHAQHDALRRAGADATLMTTEALQARVPVLRAEAARFGVWNPASADIDVHALHQGYLRGLKARGGACACDVAIHAIERDGDGWRVDAGTQAWRAPRIVDAAGAWVDEVARLAGVAPIGIEPRRRSAFVFPPPAGLDVRAWPLVIDVRESWYLKPDAGLLLGSPANADPVLPHDVQPEELDIAIAIDRIQTATTLSIRRPTRTWAGLRSFVADGDLVGGWAPDAPGFFWLAAQGGYGIQTSPAMGEAAAAIMLGRALPERLAAHGVSAAMLAPRVRSPAPSR